MDTDIGDFLTLGLLLLVPALVVFSILMVVRARRGKFHRQRIKRSSKEEK